MSKEEWPLLISEQYYTDMSLNKRRYYKACEAPHGYSCLAFRYAKIHPDSKNRFDPHYWLNRDYQGMIVAVDIPRLTPNKA